MLRNDQYWDAGFESSNSSKFPAYFTRQHRPALWQEALCVARVLPMPLRECRVRSSPSSWAWRLVGSLLVLNRPVPWSRPAPQVQLPPFIVCPWWWITLPCGTQILCYYKHRSKSVFQQEKRFPEFGRIVENKKQIRTTCFRGTGKWHT